MAERDDAAGIAAAERALYRAMIAQDFAVLDAILADDAVYTLTLREPERIDCQSVRLGFC